MKEVIFLTGLIIRDADINDAPIIAQLIYETEELPEHVWGEGSKEEILARIEFLVKDKFNRYSYLRIKVAEISGEIGGVISLLPSERISNLDVKTSIKLLSLIKGIKNKVRFIKDIFQSSSLKEGGQGELYIANVATKKEFRGLGIGKALLKESERVARYKGYKFCSLLAKDEEVVKFYESLDYEYKKVQKYFTQNLYEMAKAI